MDLGEDDPSSGLAKEQQLDSISIASITPILASIDPEASNGLAWAIYILDGRHQLLSSRFVFCR